MSPRIDAHVHFWRYSAAEYGWIDDSLAALRRDFMPSHAAAELAAVDMAGLVAVQARQTLDETAWLLELAADSKLIGGVVGWVELTNPRVADQLDRFGAKLCGVRHIVQAEPDDQFLSRADFNRGVDALKTRELAYDILIFPRHLPAAIAFVDRHPAQRFVLDHLAKPPIREQLLEPWCGQLVELARRPNVWLKLSGLVTEADPQRVTAAALRPYLELALEAFGPRRTLFGSDYPVCTAVASYRDVYRFIADFVATLSEAEQTAIFGGNAAEFYRLDERLGS
ncbi:MAG TPA: amidohydrolase family protein [Polyangiaceae bacterium]